MLPVRSLTLAALAALPLALPLPALAADLGEGPPYPERYSERDGCTPQQVIERRLTQAGWHDFHDAALKGGVASVRARDDRGEPYVLEVDRCSGRVLAANPLGGSRDGRYGDRGEDRDYDRDAGPRDRYGTVGDRFNGYPDGPRRRGWRGPY